MNRLRYKLPIIFIFLDLIFYLAIIYLIQTSSIGGELFLIWAIFHIPSSIIIYYINNFDNTILFLIFGLIQTGIIFYVDGVMRENINEKRQSNIYKYRQN